MHVQPLLPWRSTLKEMEPELKQLARAHTKEAIERLVWWMKRDNPKASPFAAKELLNRGWGQAPRYHEHDGDIRQHVISDSPQTVDQWVQNYCMDGKTAVDKASKH
jgi:hypothetical protein